MDKLAKQGGDVTKIINAFREFVTTIGEERQRFANERNVLSQQIQVRITTFTKYVELKYHTICIYQQCTLYTFICIFV